MAVQLTGIRFSFGDDHQRPLLEIDHWAVQRGEKVLIHGPSGVGKSTLMNILSGLLTCDTGEVSVLGQRLDQMSVRQRDQFRADNIGCVFQRFNLIPYLNAIDNIGLANTFSAGGNGRWREEAAALLTALTVHEDSWAKPTSNLSMGQQQRVAIARALINSPEILIADEPTSSLDSENRDNFLSLLMGLIKERDMTLIFVSHDMTLAKYFTRLDALPDITDKAD
jgi:putative ABC transport system ATP-binding protein